MNDKRHTRKSGITAAILALSLGLGTMPALAGEPSSVGDEIARQGEEAVQRMQAELRNPEHWRRQAEQAYHDHLARYLLLHTRLARNSTCECVSER